MSSKHICTSCLRGLRQQIAETRPRLQYHHVRPLSTSKARYQQNGVASTSPKQAPTVGKGVSPSISQSMAQAIRYTAPNLAEPYVAYGATEMLVRECIRVADYTISLEQRQLSDEEQATQKGTSDAWWYKEFGLEPTFNTWAQVSFLHLWMLTVRLRSLPEANAKIWHQQLIDHFFYLAEEKMTVAHNIVSRSIRNTYLKDLYIQWRGLTISYDEGLVEGDAVLAAAIWRNVCGQNEDVNLQGLAQVVSYVRSVLKGLEGMEDADIAAGQILFEDPSGEKNIASARSRLWAVSEDSPDAPLAAAPSASTGAGSTSATVRPKKWKKAPQGTVVKAAPNAKTT